MEVRIEDYNFNYTIEVDDFTKERFIKWPQIGAMCLPALDVGNFLYSFQIWKESPYLFLYYIHDPKLKKNFSLHFLFDDGSILSFKMSESAIYDAKCRHEYARLPLSHEAIESFRTKGLCAVRICDKNGNELKTRIMYDSLFSGTKDQVKAFLQDLLRHYFNVYLRALEELGIDWQSTGEDPGSPDPGDGPPELKPFKKSPCFVYLMKDMSNGFYKIGISNRPEYRERTLQAEKPTIEKICEKEYPIRPIAEAIESALHKVYADKRIRGEWFNLSEEDIAVLVSTLS